MEWMSGIDKEHSAVEGEAEGQVFLDGREERGSTHTENEGSTHLKA
jgi:hypothetical protein